ncbi:putative transposase [Noviherbaspirillum humi]|uniref:Putative transposase n=1 Tax=Noviherbaspirillum humi TaxID=1688639 RepID=A0A239KMY1_9BURK|nr:putative transposase [Noviherbaspirillum humi]
MKIAKFSGNQIMDTLKWAENGMAVPGLCRSWVLVQRHSLNGSKYGGMDASLMARMKKLEAENAGLKKMYAEERLKADILKEVLGKK